MKEKTEMETLLGLVNTEGHFFNWHSTLPSDAVVGGMILSSTQNTWRKNFFTTKLNTVSGHGAKDYTMCMVNSSDIRDIADLLENLND